jgi:hypothetical protein
VLEAGKSNIERELLVALHYSMVEGGRARQGENVRERERVKFVFS